MPDPCIWNPVPLEVSCGRMTGYPEAAQCQTSRSGALRCAGPCVLGLPGSLDLRIWRCPVATIAGSYFVTMRRFLKVGLFCDYLKEPSRMESDCRALAPRVGRKTVMFLAWLSGRMLQDFRQGVEACGVGGSIGRGGAFFDGWGQAR